MSYGPRTIAGYTLIRELGRGGMGVVYEVHDPRLDRRLALKLVLSAEADQETLLRFAREAQLLARISHPNVVQIHSVGTSEAGPYFVAERVEGEPLDRVLERHGAWEPARAAALVRDLAGAVAALHAQQVVHRDLKPGNVIVRPDGTPVLIDFGIARDPGAQSLTLTGALLGTPNYMSPEQALAQRESIGAPSDVYGLGAVLFALLSGSPPFVGRSQLAILDAVTRLEPDWPVGLPPALVELGRLAMSKASAERPSAEELSELLSRHLAGELQGRSRGRGALLSGLILAFTVVGLAALALWARSGRSPTPTPSLAERSPSQSETPRPSRAELPSMRDVMRGLRRGEVEPELLEDAQRLLVGPRSKERELLRERYVAARLGAEPSQRVASVELPSRGRAAWVDDTRLVVGSVDVRALFRWPDWRRADCHKVDYTSGGIRDNARPVVLGELAVIGGGDASGWTARCYAWGQDEVLRTFPAPTLVTSLAATKVAGRSLLAVGTLGRESDDQGTILIYDLESGELRQTLRGHTRGVRLVSSGLGPAGTPPEVSALLFSPDGRWLVSAGFAGGIRVWAVGSWRETGRMKSHWGDVRDLALDATGTRLAVSTGLRSSVRLLEFPSLKLIRTFDHRQGRPSGVTFSRDARFLFSVARQVGDEIRIGELAAYDLEDGETVATRTFMLQGPSSVALSPDGRRIAVYSEATKRVGIFEVYEVDVPPGG